MATILFRYDENDARHRIPEDILLVLNDLMAQSGKGKRIADLFTKESHHRNLSVIYIYIVQNIFHQERDEKHYSERPL